MTIRPEIVDPDYIYVNVEVVATYNGNAYSTTTNVELEQDIIDAITSHFESEANKFGKPLYHSELVEKAADSSNLLRSVIINLSLEKTVEITSGTEATYDFEFNNSIHPGSVFSNTIIINSEEWKIKDEPQGSIPYTTGKLVVYRETESGVIYHLTNAGTVDYNTGEVSIVNVQIDSILNDEINKVLILTVSPGVYANTTTPSKVYLDNNVYTNERDQLITLKSISVSLLSDNE
jgi:hypothetical protein